jgi:hypothetical protein
MPRFAGGPAAQERIKALIARGFHKWGCRLGYYLGQISGQAGARGDSQLRDGEDSRLSKQS